MKNKQKYDKCSNCGLFINIKFKSHHKCGFYNCPKCMSAVSPDSYDNHKRSHLPSFESPPELKERNQSRPELNKKPLTSGSDINFRICPTCNKKMHETTFQNHLNFHRYQKRKTETKKYTFTKIKCPTCNEMVPERDFRNHFDLHRYLTPETETKKQFPIDRSEYRHDRGAEVF